MHPLVASLQLIRLHQKQLTHLSVMYARKYVGNSKATVCLCTCDETLAISISSTNVVVRILGCQCCNQLTEL